MSVPARNLPERGDRPRRGGGAAGAPALQVRPAAGGAARAPEGGRTDAPALRVVPREVRRRRAGLVAVVGVSAVFAVMLGLVAFQAKIAQDQLRLDRMEREVRAAEEQFQQLRLQVAQLEAPARVVAEAKRLGLVRPDPEDIRYLSPTPAVVAEVAAAAGPAEASGPSGTGDAEDWAALKPVLRGAP